jgi:nitrogen fixation protein
MPQPISHCPCYLSLVPPAGIVSYQPRRDLEPPGVQAVIRVGDEPKFRQAIRVEGGWREDGASVRCGRPAVIPWRDVGNCWAGKSHPVVEVC